ncbi:MAG: TonB family protein [Pseudomonadota bacterium]
MNGSSAHPLGRVGVPSPTAKHWTIAGVLALLVHVIAALPFLPAPISETDVEIADPGEAPALIVDLPPIVRPPEPETPPEVMPEPEEQVIEERAASSPPPEPPATPREVPQLPDITPRAVPEIWSGASGSAMTLEEYLFLQDWLAAARKAVLEQVRYPEDIRRDQITGSGKIVIVGARDGEVVEWRFIEKTGSERLDREVERAMRRIRQLPPFPDGTRYDTLSFVATVRFEIIMPDGTILANTRPRAPANGSSQPSDQTELVSLARMQQCAASAAGLQEDRETIDDERRVIEGDIADYQRAAQRYERDRQPLPRRLELQRRRIGERVEAFDADVAALQQQAEAFQRVCSGGQVRFENFSAACRPYLSTGNLYCEAFGPYWERLRAAE